jgi:hypothetical protein
MWISTQQVNYLSYMFYIRHILEKKLEYNEAVHHLFINFKKAYDSFRREVLCNVLIELKKDRQMLRYSHSYCRYFNQIYFCSVTKCKRFCDTFSLTLDIGVLILLSWGCLFFGRNLPPFAGTHLLPVADRRKFYLSSPHTSYDRDGCHIN